MNPMDVRNVSYTLDKMDSLYQEASKILSGYTDMTLHGRYIGEHLPADEYEKLRDIALRYVGREYWTQMQNLKFVHGIPVEFADWEVTTIDQLIAYWKHLQPPTRRTE